jgi:hypothetical protein
MTEHEQTAAEIADSVMKHDNEMAAFLAGRGPHEIGAILGELVSRWVAGHAPQVREEVWDRWTDLVVDLIPVQEVIQFGPQGHPARAEEANGEDDTSTG